MNCHVPPDLCVARNVNCSSRAKCVYKRDLQPQSTILTSSNANAKSRTSTRYYSTNMKSEYNFDDVTGTGTLTSQGERSEEGAREVTCECEESYVGNGTLCVGNILDGLQQMAATVAFYQVCHSKCCFTPFFIIQLGVTISKSSNFAHSNHV